MVAQDILRPCGGERKGLPDLLRFVIALDLTNALYRSNKRVLYRPISNKHCNILIQSISTMISLVIYANTLNNHFYCL